MEKGTTYQEQESVLDGEKERWTRVRKEGVYIAAFEGWTARSCESGVSASFNIESKSRTIQGVGGAIGIYVSDV